MAWRFSWIHLRNAGGCLVVLAAALVACRGTSPLNRHPTAIPAAAPARPGFSPDKLRAMDQAIEAAIQAGQLPGAVLWLEHRPPSGPTLTYHRAYGHRAVVPKVEPMTEDTVFDAASLTKVVATMPVILHLAEAGRLDLDAPVARYLPGFGAHGKTNVTVRHLLTHTSGLRPGLPLASPWKGTRAALELAAAETPTHPPGSRFVYSDINFIVLGELAAKLGETSLADYAHRHIFAPLGMADTRFRPLLSQRLAPTEQLTNGTILRGTVHDPTARRLDGIAGHAGLFTTAADLARYARAWTRPPPDHWLRPVTCGAATSVQTAAGLPRRGLGWDIDSPYAGPRGERFPIGSYGHTGWTGTSLWIDPFSQTFIILLSNRNHPTEAGDVRALRRTLGTLAAEAVPEFDFDHVPGALPRQERARSDVSPQVDGITAATPPQFAADPPAPATSQRPVLTGIDVLARDGFASLRGKRVALITNHTGHDRQRRSTIDLLFEAPGVKLVALFSPEHGLRGVLDEPVKDGHDPRTGLTVHSLYGERRAPTLEQLAGLDFLIFDIQDIGCRFYTYISTLGNCLAAAGQAKVSFLVLDRPNPLGGNRMDGPLLTAPRSFIAWHEIPLIHGLTTGELAQLFNTERQLGADLKIIPCEHWRRTDEFDITGLPWTNPSPNMRRLTAAALYPGIGLLEFCRLSVGRGTDTPFEIIGAPFIQDVDFAAELNRAAPPGARFVPVRFTPTSSAFAGTNCGGVQILVTDRAALKPVELGLTLAQILYRKYPADLNVDAMQRLLGDEPTLQGLKTGRPISQLAAAWQPGLAEFRKRRERVRIY